MCVVLPITGYCVANKHSCIFQMSHNTAVTSPRCTFLTWHRQSAGREHTIQTQFSYNAAVIVVARCLPQGWPLTSRNTNTRRYRCTLSHTLAHSVDTASAGTPPSAPWQAPPHPPILPSWSLIPTHRHTNTHTRTHTQCYWVEIRSPARRPHTWACLRRKRALGGLRSMRLSTGSTKSGQLCSWPGLALWGLCSWERHVSQKRRKKGQGREEGGQEDTEKRKRKQKKGLGYFELITHSSPDFLELVLHSKNKTF